MPDQHIVIAGAGSIGCFAGGLLAAAGRRVTLLGRARVLDDLRAHGLTLTDFSGLSLPVPADRLTLSEDPACLADADLVLVTVKSGATADMAQLIARHAPAHAPVVSLQNGMANAAVLRAALPGRDIRAGMVPFNVVPMGQGRYHRASSGDIVIGAGPVPLAAVLSVPHLKLGEVHDIDAVQWGKLLVNLTNALNALSGLTVHQMLMRRDWRRLMADQIAEALTVLRAAGITAKPTTPLPYRLVPFVLRLPTPLFRRIAAQMLTVDPTARTSMAYDLIAGRLTEVDALQGEIIAVGAKTGVPTPLCARIAGLIHRAEAAGAGLPGLTPSQVRAS